MQDYLDNATVRFWLSMVFLFALLVLDCLQVFNFAKGLKVDDDFDR